jgi:hypothetical protein
MKKITKMLCGILVFVALFYHQYPGINFSLFSLFVWTMLFFDAGKGRNRRPFGMLSAAVFLSAVSFAWYGDVFSFFALYFSILAIGLHVQYPRLNNILYPLLVPLNYLSFIFRVFFFKYWLPKTKPGNRFWKKVIALFLIPAVSGIAFITVYTSGSNLFSSFFQRFYINFDLEILIFLALAGFFFMFNYWFMLIPKDAIKLNQYLKDDFSGAKEKDPAPSFTFLDVDFERKSGEISLIVVNLILLFFIFTYNYEQFFMPEETGNLSSELHQRVATIIFSIVMAIALLMFYFKSTFNFDPKAGLLKKLAVSWMILNAALILSAFLKNGEYIFEFGLTFKRIGVYIFLLLSLAGLWLCYLKIKNRKTNGYLINRMFKIFFGTFIVCAAVNFSWIITQYNITFLKKPDIQYLRDMEYNKQVLYNTYHDDPAWQEYFKSQRTGIREEKNRSFLSSKLYYLFIEP